MINIDNDCTKGLRIDDDTYIVRAQEYRYLAADNSPEIVSKTYIEVLKFPGEMDVVTFTGEGAELVGYLYRTHDLANSNPKFWEVPKFIPFDDQFYDEKRATYFGATGFNFAQKELEKLSKIRLAKGIKRYLIKDYDRDIILCLGMFDKSQQRCFTFEQVQLKAFKAPETYKWDNYAFRLVLTADEDDKTTAYYTLSGTFQR